MEQYIPKAAVVAEIKRRIERCAKQREDMLNVQCHTLADDASARMGELNCFQDFLDTLEVKEVDLEHEVESYWKQCDMTWCRDAYSMTHIRSMLSDIAKHFFELGIKAQKGEIWQVVDNVNHPQADKNKIYCVFTKNRYILATVINHPKDEELLQWKCTEFPHHRYDMCEGDKYMQIV